MTPAEKFVLSRVHFLRMKHHWGKKWAEENAFINGRWPLTDRDWRQVPHGHSSDTNVEMAKWHLALAKEIVSP